MTRKQPTNHTQHHGLPSAPPDEASRGLELWERNQETSPLLQLPFEIRMRIFTHILAVGQIHIRYRPWQRRKLARGGVAHIETTPGYFFSLVLGADENPWHGSPAALTRAPQRITLLSNVCRQLYVETAVLPFRLNAWSFENSRLMERYVQTEKRLTAQQRRAVQTLVVREALPKAMENRFAGLKTIVRRDGNKLETEPVDLGRERSSRNWHTWADYDWGLHW